MIRPLRFALVVGCGLTLCGCASFHHAPKTTAAAEAPPPKHGWFGGGHGHAHASKAPVWPQAYVALPPDPAMRFGVLPNGLRYVVMKNATPGGQASLRLRIGAGSMDESDSEQGLAHLLEHMAFNGSTHVPRGEMVRILERHGLAFGADTNASTSWEETVYKLDLPKADDDTVDSSLMLLREIAGELNLDQGAIDAEKGVVLSEERLRDTPSYRVLKQSFGLTMQGQLAAQRFPIGLVDVVKHATHDQLASFYHRYYRPEDSELIAVGDFDPDAMEARIKAKFGDWVGRGPAGAEPDRGTPKKRGVTTKLVIEPGAAQTIQVNWVAPPDLSVDSKARRRRETIRALGLAVLNRRLDRLAKADDPPFVSAAAYSSDDFHSAQSTTIQASADPGQWAKALTAIETEQRRLLKYGVSSEELAVEVDAYRATLKATAQGAATRTTPSIADDIVATLTQPQVETAPAEDLALFDEAVKGLKPGEVDAAMRAAFGGSGPLVMLASPDPVGGGEAALAKTFADARAAPVAPPSAHAALSWPYTDFGTPGEVAEQHDVIDLDTVFVRFKNGVRLTIKPTKFREDQILVQARIGRGDLELPANRPTPAWAAGSAFPDGGLDQMGVQDVDQVLRSRIVGHDFTVAEDAFVLSGATRPDDLETQMQLLAAYVAHPGWRPEAFVRMHNFAPTYLDQLAATPSGVMSRDLGRLIRSGDQRWGMPSREAIAAQTPQALKDMIAPALQDGPIEVVVVGDVNVDKAIEAVGETFGALPPRVDPPPPQSAVSVVFPAPTPQPLVLTHSGRADQAVGFIAWPTDDFLSDTQRARTLSVLSAVMRLRLTDQLRKAEGVTYSPSAGSEASDVFPHYGDVAARVEVPPAKLDDFFTDVAAIAADLKANTISADELNRAKGPALEGLEKRRQTNEYWLNALTDAQVDPRRLTAIRTSVAQLGRVSAEDVRAAAQAYLIDAKAWKLEIRPKGK